MKKAKNRDMAQATVQAMEQPDARGDHYQVAFLDDIVVKVPRTDQVSLEVVDDNRRSLSESGAVFTETWLSEEVPTEFSMLQERGVEKYENSEIGEEVYLRQVVNMLDEVAEETDFCLDAKNENFVVIDGTVKYCDIGDKASICEMDSEHMYNVFITTYRDDQDLSFTEADERVASNSIFYDRKVPDFYLDKNW